jgi:uncharacterized protein YndB with AHSA1/START domain
MQKLNYSILINAPKQKVWETMLNDETYRQWTSAFQKGSHYEGKWEEGSDIRFTDGSNSGMIAKVVEARPYDFISLKHLAEVINGKQTDFSEPIFENYTFKDKDGATELLIEMDSLEKYADMFNDLWPKALEKLKALAER